MKVGVLVSGALLALWLGGCSSAYMLTGSPGTNTASIGPGTTSQVVESTLGKQQKEWRNGHGVIFRLYEFSGGRPSYPGYALLMGVAAVGTLGVLEVVGSNAVDNDKRHGRDTIPVRMIVSFDQSDIVLGVFEEFDYLPADGRKP